MVARATVSCARAAEDWNGVWVPRCPPAPPASYAMSGYRTETGSRLISTATRCPGHLSSPDSCDTPLSSLRGWSRLASISLRGRLHTFACRWTMPAGASRQVSVRSAQLLGWSECFLACILLGGTRRDRIPKLGVGCRVPKPVRRCWFPSNGVGDRAECKDWDQFFGKISQFLT